MFSPIDFMFRKLTERHYGIIGVGKNTIDKDYWRLWGFQNGKFWMGFQEDYTTFNPPLEDAKNLHSKNADEILKSEIYPSSRGTDPLGACIERTTSRDDLVFYIGAMDAPLDIDIETECILTLQEDGTFIKKNIEIEAMGNNLGQLFTKCVWTDENLGFNSTYHNDLKQKLDDLRILGLAALKQSGPKALQAVFETHDYSIAELALGQIRKDKRYARLLLDFDHTQNTFKEVYTEKEKNALFEKLSAIVKRHALENSL
jgi:hypothetical protein